MKAGRLLAHGLDAAGVGRPRRKGIIFTPVKMSIWVQGSAMASACWGGSWAPSSQ
jgi:hypothetical protein